MEGRGWGSLPPGFLRRLDGARVESSEGTAGVGEGEDGFGGGRSGPA